MPTNPIILDIDSFIVAPPGDFSISVARTPYPVYCNVSIDISTANNDGTVSPLKNGRIDNDLHTATPVAIVFDMEPGKQYVCIGSGLLACANDTQGDVHLLLTYRTSDGKIKTLVDQSPNIWKRGERNTFLLSFGVECKE